MIASNYGPDCRAGMCPLYPLHLALLYLCLALPLLVAVVDGSLATWQLAFSRNQVSDSPAWNNGKEVPIWGVAEIQKISPSTTGRCYCCH